jgi:hypothetical protein
MKKLVLFLLFISMAIFSNAQFPQPTNFHFSYVYYNTNQDGPCGTQWVYGPTYCSYFNWSAPDTTTTLATLDHYILYYYDYYDDHDTDIIALVSDTFFTINAGFMGEMWVTAVYQNPAGESVSSNIEMNNSLPISIEEISFSFEIKLYPDPTVNNLTIETNTPSTIQILSIQGQLIKTLTASGTKTNVDVSALPGGVYIVEEKTEKGLAVKKFVKE